MATSVDPYGALAPYQNATDQNSYGTGGSSGLSRSAIDGILSGFQNTLPNLQNIGGQPVSYNSAKGALGYLYDNTGGVSAQEIDARIAGMFPNYSPVTAVQGSATTNGGSYGSGGTASPNPNLINTVNQVYDSRNSRLSNLLGQIPTQRDQALNSYNSAFDVNKGSLDNSFNQGQASLGLQSQQNDQQKVRSYRDIASGIRNTLESASNRLGSMNASDSSAAPMLAYALANLQAQQRGQANDVYGQNAAQIGLAKNNMEGDYSQQMNALNSEKRQRVQDIADRYQQTRQQIMDEMQTSDEARAYELANLGQQYTMKALSDITQLENDYSTASQQWVQNALSSMPQVNTQSFSQTPTMNSYGTYGRGAAVDGGSPLSYQDSLAVSPLRKIRETA